MSSVTSCQVVDGGKIYSMTCSLNSAVSIIQVKNGLTASITAGNSIKILLGPFTNPGTNTNSDSMSVTSYTDNTFTYVIDTVAANMVPGLECTSPCKTCLTTSPTSCTSCYTDGTTALPFLSGITCISSCPDKYFNLNNICTACDVRCKTCSGTTTCDSCDISGTYKY
jgi:hypothetical protein